MNLRRLPLLALALALPLAWGCGLFEDLRPRTVSLKIDGPAGTRVSMLMATNFVAGVNEQGVTQVQVFGSDTVTAVLPVDTVIGISAAQRFFLQLTPAAADSLGVRVRIDVDDRNRYNDSGLIFASDPFRWVFVFNQNTTLAIELL